MTQSICVAGGEDERWQGRDGGCKQGVDFSSVGHRRRFSGWKPTSIVELSLENRLLQLTGFLDPAAEKVKEGKTRLRRSFARLKER